jgi:carboxymethylenebutenolidase
MPIYESHGIEYEITQGRIQLVEGNISLPAYWSHPMMGSRYPAVALVHDWWGITPLVRRLANFFAQTGYYVIVPDLFEGKTAATPEAAIELVKGLGDQGYPRINAALTALEQHHQTNSDVAVIGLGMGGSLAYEAAILRDGLEGAVACFGFPQRYFGRLKGARAPVLALYGEAEPYITPADIQRVRAELAASVLAAQHQVEILPKAGHEIFSESAGAAEREAGRQAIDLILRFLEQHLHPPERPQRTIR